jgi:hypothetical protein
VVRLDHLRGEKAGWISESYYLTEETENHLKTLRYLIEKPEGCGVFLIGQYGSGKSHFLAYLAQQLEIGAFVSKKPATVTVSLLNYKASRSLEAILDEALGFPAGVNDRREIWKEIGEKHPAGLVLVLDELSEFLRSKPAPQSFSEDLRYLQFLGEWAQEHPLWIVAALQEQIEHTGEIEYDLFRKIKDRYPIRFLLTAAHVKNLIAQRILRKRPEYRAKTEALANDLKQLYPNSALDFETFCELYPIHPATLEILDEVRDRFSQARGIIDFVLTQLLGNEARGIPPFLDRPWGNLITPDLIEQHFSDLFEIQPEFQGIAQKVLPYYRKQMPVLFEAEAQRDLAWRLVRLLILVHLSPRRDSLAIEEAAEWLLLRISSVDPEKNREVIRRILDVLSGQGSFLKKQGARYALDLQDDSKQQLEQLLAKAVEELKTRGDYVFELLVPLLENAEFNPFSLPRDRWHLRRVRWHFHDRELQIYFGPGNPPEQSGLTLQIGLPWGAAAGCGQSYTILPGRLEITPELLELAALCRLKDKPLPARVLTRVQERIGARIPSFRAEIRTAYHESSIIGPEGRNLSPPLVSFQGGVGAWLNSYGEWILRQMYPQFERFAPTYGPLPKEAYRQFMTYATENDLGAELAPDYVKLMREAYLVPMGLMQRRGQEYVVIPKLESHELVRLLGTILGHHPTPARVYQHMGAPIFGLVPDQIQILLLLLLVQGEIDIVKGDRSYRETYETLPNPIQYDRILPGQALNMAQLRQLEALCESFRIAVPKQWSVLAQKRAIEQLRRYGARQRDQLIEFVSRVKSSGESESLSGPFEELITKWLSIEKGEHELQGFEHFLYSIGNPQKFAEEAMALASLPVRYERLLRESQRYRHLFGYPCVSQCANPQIAVEIQSLEKAPPLDRPAELEEWLNKCRDVYSRYSAWYSAQHDRHWKDVHSHRIWIYRVPTVSGSRHAGTATLAGELNQLREKAREARCAGLAPLDFQPICRCGFDGNESPVSPILRQFDQIAGALEKELTLFFQQDKVKSRVRDWSAQKLETNTQTIAYLEGKSDYPDTANIQLFDQHLAGLELVQRIRPEALLEILEGRTWDKPSLMRTLDQFFDRCGPRITLAGREAPLREELVAWCYEQALKTGCPLPSGLTAAEHSMVSAIVQPKWIGDACLGKLEQMNLDEAVTKKILGWVLDGLISPPQIPPESGPVAAALHMIRPTQSIRVEELASRAALLYGQHRVFMELRPRPWLGRLDELAESPLAEFPERLEDLLKAVRDFHWIVVDCLGLPFLGMLQKIVPECFPSWQWQGAQFAAVSERSSTDAFYMGLVERDFNKAFEKINAVDALIHGRKLEFPDLERLARAELEIAFRKLKLDPAIPVVVFGDHGFRLDKEGREFVHGGPSTLERIVPMLLLSPR